MKKSVAYSLYAISFVLIFLGLVTFNTVIKVNSSESVYVSKGILDYNQYIPVVTNSNTISRPYYDSDVNQVLLFYNVADTEENQARALIQYDDTYIQSNGVAYSKGVPFDVISVMDGTVKEVKSDEILGNIIVIEHDNGYMSTYESVSDITIEPGMPVVKGQLIAKSSTSNILKELDNHLYFELSKNGENVNPEEYYNRSINE